MSNSLFGLYDFFIISDQNGNRIGKVEEGKIMFGNSSFEKEKLLDCYPIYSECTYEKGFAIKYENKLLLKYFGNNVSDLIIDFDYESMVIFANQSILHVNNGFLYLYRIGFETETIRNDVPRDFEFLFHDSRSCIAVSRDNHILWYIRVDKKPYIIELPGGFTRDIISVSAIDDQTFVFSTDKGEIHQYTVDGVIKTISVQKKIKKIINIDLDPYETTSICLTENNQLIGIRFLSKSTLFLCTYANDFCICYTPFPVIIVNIEGKIQQIEKLDSTIIEPSIFKMIDALQNRIINGYGSLSRLRDRIQIRKDICQGVFEKLPPLIKLFGDEENDTKFSSDIPKPVYWIEKAAFGNELYLEIKSDSAIPLDSLVVLCSPMYSISTLMQRIIQENSIIIQGPVSINSAKEFTPLYIFIVIESCIIFIDSIDISSDDIQKFTHVPRISESYSLHFPDSRIPTSTLSASYSSIMDINNNCIAISSDTIEGFEQKLIALKSQLNENIQLNQVPKTKKQVEILLNFAKKLYKELIEIQKNGFATKNDMIRICSDTDEMVSNCLW